MTREEAVEILGLAPGLRAVDIAETLDISVPEVSVILRALLADGLVRKTGKTRRTQYYLVDAK